jgi:hypothetical protein
MTRLNNTVVSLNWMLLNEQNLYKLPNRYVWAQYLSKTKYMIFAFVQFFLSLEAE